MQSEGRPTHVQLIAGAGPRVLCGCALARSFHKHLYEPITHRLGRLAGAREHWHATAHGAQRCHCTTGSATNRSRPTHHAGCLHGGCVGDGSGAGWRKQPLTCSR